MPDLEQLKEIAENLDEMRLGPDDTFRFKCYGCGKCCRDREDILLNPRDLFRLAKHLKLEPNQLIDRYCETYVGPQSLAPLVRLLPRGKNKICPLLKDNRCSVHASKPIVCALYPLGRIYAAPKDKPDAQPELGFILQQTTCGGHKTNTVRDYLESFGIPLEDEFYLEWNTLLMYLSGYSREALSKGFTMHMMDAVWETIHNVLYLHYDMEADFQIQFSANAFSLRAMLEQVKAATFAPPMGSPCLFPTMKRIEGIDQAK